MHIHNFLGMVLKPAEVHIIHTRERLNLDWFAAGIIKLEPVITAKRKSLLN